MTAAVRDLGVCRWSLECTAAAVVVVKHSTLGEYPACGDHAADHQKWRDLAQQQHDRGRLFIHSDGVGRPEPPGEPGPECYCPDTPRKRVPYCPEHGTKAQRGVDPLADDDD